MLVLLGSKNPSKERSLKWALTELGIDFEIKSFDVASGVGDEPIGSEIITGAQNRNANLKSIAKENDIEYDYLCSIEGGADLDESGFPYIISYCAVEDKNGKKNIGKSLALSISLELYEYIKDIGSLNRVIEKINNCENYNQKGGITGYLTNGLFDRQKIDEDVVMAAFMPFIFEEKMRVLENRIKGEGENGIFKESEVYLEIR